MLSCLIFLLGDMPKTLLYQRWVHINDFTSIIKYKLAGVPRKNSTWSTKDKKSQKTKDHSS